MGDEADKLDNEQPVEDQASDEEVNGGKSSKSIILGTPSIDMEKIINAVDRANIQAPVIPNIKAPIAMDIQAVLDRMVHLGASQQASLASLAISQQAVTNIFLGQEQFRQHMSDIAQQLVTVQQGFKVLPQTLSWPDISPVVMCVASGAWEYHHTLEKADENAPKFIKRHGWPLPSRASLKTIHEVVEMRNKGKREVNAFMLAEFGYKTENWRESYDYIMDSKTFKKRRKPLQEGIEAMERDHHHAAICTLLPMVEGSLVEIVLEGAWTRNGAYSKAIQKLRDEDPRSWQGLLCDNMIGLLVSTMGVNYLFASFEPEDYDSWTRKTRLNRHAILHGISLKYANQVNSLKLFFLLVSLADTYEQLPYVNSGA